MESAEGEYFENKTWNPRCLPLAAELASAEDTKYMTETTLHH